MITLFGYSLSALLPWALVAAPLGAALLVYAYRTLGSKSRRTVSALFLFETLPRILPGRKKFVPPLQFWLELLCFIFLSAAAAGLILDKKGDHIALVIDSSLSMAATHEDGELRLAISKAALINHINQADPYTTYTLFSAAGSLSRISPPKSSAASVNDSLSAISPVFEQDRLASLLETLGGSGEFDGIWVYSDHSFQREPSKEATLALRTSTATNPAERAKASNIWIAGVAERVRDGQSYLEVSIQVASKTVVDVTASAVCYLELLPTQESLPAITSRIEIPDGGVRGSLLGPLSPSWKACEVRVTPTSNSLRDALPQDNSAWIARRTENGALMLKSKFTPEELGLLKLKNMRVTSTPADSESGQARTTTPTIYHRTAIPPDVRGSFLAIYPPVGEIPGGGRISEPGSGAVPISRWIQSHPILQYLQVPILSLTQVRLLDCPDGATPFLFVSKGAVACAGESADRRYVLLGFEILPFDGLKNASLSVLTLNIFKWLFQDTALENRPSSVGYATIPPGAESARIILPQRSNVPIDASRRAYISRPSTVLFSAANGAPVALQAFHFSSTLESDIRAEAPITVSNQPLRRNASERSQIELWTIASLLALALLAIDLIRKFIGRSSWTR